MDLLPGSDPNSPFWECDRCKEKNSNLRDVCVFCDKGIKLNSRRKTKTAHKTGRYADDI